MSKAGTASPNSAKDTEHHPRHKQQRKYKVSKLLVGATLIIGLVPLLDPEPRAPGRHEGTAGGGRLSPGDWVMPGYPLAYDSHYEAYGGRGYTSHQ